MKFIDALPFMAQILVTVGLTAWVYTTLKTSFDAIVKSQNEKINSLQNEVTNLKISENKWFRKYHKLLTIFANNGCKNKECPVQKKVNEFLAEEGDVI